ncbi:MAG TPA: FtsX-like permease family protein [Chitinophagaceae bacterium]|nr:FtsX-like permease family protein [Chitinophagaceae bacterium]
MPSLSLGMLPALLALFVAVMLVGGIAGSYVAYYLSSFDISRIFKAVLLKSSQSRFKKGLIVAQFAIATGLVACTAAVAMQLRYSKTLDMGFDREKVLVLPLTGETAQKNYAVLQQQLRVLPSVQQVSAVSEIPYNGITNNGFVPEGDTKALIIHQLDADEHLLEAFHIRMKAGSWFSASRPDLANGYVINEALAKILGWQTPIGKTISRDGVHPIIGVVSDFHFASLHDRVEPLIITNKPSGGMYSYLAIKYTGSDAANLVASVQQSWKNIFGATPFDYWFLDDAFNTVYKSEEQFRQVFMYFSVLSVVLSLAGVFGLVALTVKQRVKEFGIRKVLGANTMSIILITVKEFAALVVLAAIIITPAAWYYIHSWLQNFAYHIGISPWLFVACSAAVLVVTICVISLQAAKAAMANPVKSLRME